MKRSTGSKNNDKQQKVAVAPSLNQAATGLFQPSESPMPRKKSAEERGAESIINRMEGEEERREDDLGASTGKVELDSTPGPNDHIVGPDLGERPHRVASTKHIDR